MIKNRHGEIIDERKTKITNISCGSHVAVMIANDFEDSQEAALCLLYNTTGGRLALEVLTKPIISKLVGRFMDSPASAVLIPAFVRKNHIDISQYDLNGVFTYNQFFTRKIRNGMRSVDYNPDSFISPCDAKLSVYKICPKSVFCIKNSPYRVRDLLANDELAKKYNGGWCMIFRLEVSDYHRYCYIDNGTKNENTFINGELHTVNPVVLGHYNVYKRNCREFTTLHTDNFGDVTQVEVGAMMVGKIANLHQQHSFCRGDEKGMFMFGGSTIVLLVQKEKVLPDSDILANTAQGFETAVKLGEKIGTSYSISKRQ